MEPVQSQYKPSPTLEKIFNENKESLKNKTIALLFLDKVSRLTGEAHKDAEQLYSYGYGSSLYTSLNLIEYLENLLPKITNVALRNSVQIWINEEKKYLSYADQIDTWRARKDIVKFILTHEGKEKGVPVPEVTFDIPDESIAKMVKSLRDKALHLKQGETIKMLSGTTMHEVRLRATRTANGYHVVYFDTGTGRQVSLQKKKLGTEFWTDLLKFKLTKNHGKPKSLLGGAKSISLSLRKSKQLTNSCPAQSILADLKYHIVETIGIKAYKDLKKMLIQEVARTEKGKLNPIIEKYLNLKAETKGQKPKAKKQVKQELFEKTLREASRDPKWADQILAWIGPHWEKFLDDPVRLVAGNENELMLLQEMKKMPFFSKLTKREIHDAIARQLNKPLMTLIDSALDGQHPNLKIRLEEDIFDCGARLQDNSEELIAFIKKLQKFLDYLIMKGEAAEIIEKGKRGLQTVVNLAFRSYPKRSVNEGFLEINQITESYVNYDKVKEALLEKEKTQKLTPNEEKVLAPYRKLIKPVLDFLEDQPVEPSQMSLQALTDVAKHFSDYPDRLFEFIRKVGQLYLHYQKVWDEESKIKTANGDEEMPQALQLKLRFGQAAFTAATLAYENYMDRSVKEGLTNYFPIDPEDPLYEKLLLATSKKSITP